MFIRCFKRNEIEARIKEVENSVDHELRGKTEGRKWTPFERETHIKEYHYYKDRSTWSVTAIFVAIAVLMLLPKSCLLVTGGLFLATVTVTAYFTVREAYLENLFKHQVTLKREEDRSQESEARIMAKT